MKQKMDYLWTVSAFMPRVIAEDITFVWIDYDCLIITIHTLNFYLIKTYYVEDFYYVNV